MRPDLPSPAQSLVRLAVCSLALAFAALVTAPGIRGGQEQRGYPQQGANAKSRAQTRQEARRRPARRRKRGLFENPKATVVIGGNLLQVKGDRPGQFQETRDFPKGPFLRDVRLKFESNESPFFVDFKGWEIGERDRRLTFEAGRVGKFRTRFLYDELPHYFSSGRSLHVSTAPGVLAVDPAIRALLQAGPTASAAPSQMSPAFPALVNQVVENAPVIQLRVHYDRLLVTQSYRPTKNLELYMRAQNVRRNGTRPRPTGTFANETNGPNGDLVWEAMGVELPEPVSYRTTNLTFGVQYSRPKWRVGVQYDVSVFRNDIPSLTWENPFRVTDRLANPPAYNVGRNRFVRAQLALPPDNDFQSITFRAGVDLPGDTQVRGAVSWGKLTQDEPFLPYTLNSAMVSANLLPGQPPLFELAPPQPSLNGEVHTLNQDYALASRPWKNMRFLFQYRSNDRDNDTPVLVFPGLPAFGDSGVRTAVDFYNLPIENFPSSYTRQNTTASWEWDPTKKLGIEVEYDWEIWSRTFREAAKTNEHSVRGRLDYKWRPGVALKLDYLHSRREPRAYLTQPLTFNPNVFGGSWVATPGTPFVDTIREEFNQLRRFDESDRTRHNAGVSLEVTRFENLTFSASYRYFRDDYDKQFYGLHFDVQSAVDAEVTYFPTETTFFYANYSREQNQSGYRGLGHRIAGAARNVTACCAILPIANSFDRSSRINFDMLQVGFNSATEGERTVVNASYGLGFARDRTDTFNPFPILSVSPRTAGAIDYPDVVARQQEANVTVTHKLRDGMELGFAYRFQPYRLDDYYTNNLQPYSFKQPAATDVSVFTPRYLFLDARFTTYHAHSATFFMRFTF
jgi:MtrB/PioB family decaheme-associated outer membrane protein